ncbi:MAG: serine/threonine-protein kinase [Polyangia bacterium]
MLAEGILIGSYVLSSRWAQGSFSRVYEGHDPSTGQKVAIKVLDPEACAHAEIVARFLNEARLLSTLSQPHLVRAVAIGGLPSGEPYVVLEWMPSTLASHLDAGALPVATALRLAGQIAAGVVELHSRGLVHRDLKPANVLLDREQLATAQAKLADLGLAKYLRPDEASASALLYVSTVRGTRLGTWEYMPPELWIDAKEVEGRADIYSLGILLFQMLTGRVPFTAAEPQALMAQHLFEPPALNAISGLLGSEGAELLGAMLAKRARERPDAASVLRALNALFRR